MKNILFVCAGNTCRSPMAEGFLRQALRENESLAKKYSVSSAGVSASEGSPPSKFAVQALLDGWGVDISAHRSGNIFDKDKWPWGNSPHTPAFRNESGWTPEESGLILTMENCHKEIILSALSMDKQEWDRWKSVFGIHTLKEYTSDPCPAKDDETVSGNGHGRNKDSNLDIEDPWRGPLSEYMECAREIKKEIDKLVAKLQQKN